MQSQRIRRVISGRKDLDDGDHKMGNWSLTKETVSPRWQVYIVHHRGTKMLQWNDYPNGGPWVTFFGLGHGSVTDQQIVNAILEEMHVDMYFSRKGGSHYVNLDHKDVPKYRRKVPA